ncbi:MAG: hypothetical protein ACJAZV_000756, partial [Roseivirga sp.]
KPKYRGLGRLPAFISAMLTKWEFNRLEILISVKIDIIWNFDSSRFFNLYRINSGVLKICHMVDLNQNIQRVLLAATADICVGTTRYILEELKKHNIKSFKIGHGYQPPNQFYDDFNFEMPGNNDQKAFYVGNLSMKYIDWDILMKSAEAYSEIDFIFVGPNGLSNLGEALSDPAKEKIKTLPNVFFKDPVHAKHIPQLLQKADVLLVAYQEIHHKDQASPHKMPEYLASGKTIIATFTEEFERVSPNLMMSKKNTDYPSLFLGVKKNFVKANKSWPTYEDRLLEIERIIDEY